MAVWTLKERNDLVRANQAITPGNKGLFGGNNPALNSVDHLNVTITSNATDFGDLTEANRKSAAAGAVTRFIRWGGETPSAVNTCDFANPFNAGNFTDFGDLTATGQTTNTAHSNNVFAVGASGQGSANANLNKMTVATQGNAAQFGDATRNLTWSSGGGNRTRFLTAGIYPQANTIDIKSMATDGDSVDFGDLSSQKWGIGTASDTTRAVFCGGSDPSHSDDIEFVTISTAGNVTDFGNLTAASADSSVASNSKRAVIQGQQSPSNLNQLDVITIQSAGNAADFADLAVLRHQCFGGSNGDGGIPQEGSFGQRISVTQDGTHMPGSGRAFAVGGQLSDNSGTIDIDTYNIQTLGNTRNFGDLIRTASNGIGAGSSRTRAVCLSGYYFTSPYYSDMIQSFEMASEGNAVDFGNAVQERYGLGYGAVGNTTRGVFMGGYAPGSPYIVNDIDFLTFATMGNATDFGDLTNVKQSPAQASNNTRGLCQGGTAPAQLDIIDYVTIASAGNATDFGDSTVGRSNCAGAASSVRAVQAGGGTPSVSNVIDYVTIASTGDATDFGDLTQAGKAPSPTSDATRAVFGGRHTPSKQTTMDFITIATTGNASDFGDLKAAASEKGGISDSHAGLQG